MVAVELLLVFLIEPRIQFGTQLLIFRLDGVALLFLLGIAQLAGLERFLKRCVIPIAAAL